MKNSNLFKKFAVMMVSAMMVLTSFAMPTFAAGETEGSVSVANVEKNAEVKVYQFVKMETIDGQGEWVPMLKAETDLDTYPNGYRIMETFTSADKITENDKGMALIPQNLIILASKAAVKGELGKGTELTTFVEDKDDKGENTGFGTYSGKVDKAGMYVVIVKHKGTSEDDVYVYNPMALGVAYKGQNLGTASVDANGNLNVTGGNLDPAGNKVYAKRETIPFDKQVTRKDSANGTGGTMGSEDALAALNDKTTNTENEQTTNDGESNNHRGDTAGKGDIVNYTITSKIPAYADNYKAETLVFNVYDKLSTGLEFQNDVEVYVGKVKIDSNWEKDTETWKLITKASDADDKDKFGENTFMVKFHSNFIKEHFTDDVVIKYSAKVGDNCVQNFDPETNTASLKYTNGPGEEKDEGPITTYHYTFTINGKTQKNDKFENREVVKVGVDETGAQVFGEKEGQTVEEGWKPLQGATFELYKAADMKEDLTGPAAGASAIRTAVSAADGRLMKDENGTEPGLDRLDAGVYYLIEKTVPNPYKVNSAPVRIVIKAELYQEDVDENTKAGMLKSYKIIVAGKDETGKYPTDLEAGVVGGSYTWNHESQTVTRNVGNTSYFVEKKVSDLKDGDKIKRYNATDKEWAEQYSDYNPLDFTEEDANEIVRVLVDPQGHHTEGIEGAKDEAADIRNTTSGTLPSTGGMGTVAFTVGGIAIMLAALFLLMGGKKKREDN